MFSIDQKMIKKIVHEPILHFLIIGGIIFLSYELFGTEEYLPQNNVIQVSTSSVENYVKQYSAQMGRAATEDEIRGFIEKHIRDEGHYISGL